MTDRKKRSFSAALIATNLQLPEFLKRCNYLLVKVLAILADAQGFSPRFGLPSIKLIT
ncbi:hypothetical protein [Nostoc sp. PCC 9305]|uniref:hypothetical protein n=1 Tax=Nostoc sp. PCC 9305 TaxID=296636 RepID=UPI0039C6D711